MRNRVFVLIGHSASGKSTIEQKLKQKGYPIAVSHTTRPQRPGEVDGINYYFITEDEFLRAKENDLFVETTTYRGWHYGLSKKQLVDNVVVSIEPIGLRQLLQLKDVKIISIFIKVNERTRMTRLMNRLDNVDEAIRRLTSDRELFANLQIDYVVENYDLDSAIEQIEKIIKEN